MTSAGETIKDRVPRDAPGSLEIGFDIPQAYNASAILFDNLARSRGAHAAITGPCGGWTYNELCAAACQWGNALKSLGLGRGARVLLFLDDTPVYPAVFFGAIRAGLVPLLINTLTPPDLINFYLKDSAAEAAITDAAFAAKFDSTACDGTNLRRIVISNGVLPAAPAAIMQAEAAFLDGQPSELKAAPTARDDMAFWQYSSGSTGRPKGIVHLQHDMAYTAASYAKHILKIAPSDICFSVPKIFFAYGLGNSITFPFSVGAASLLLPGQPKPATIFDCIRQYRPTLFFALPTLYTALTKAPEASGARLSSIRFCVSAAEVLAAEIADGWRRLCGHSIVEGMGSTEALHIYLSNTETGRKTGSAGKRVPGYEIVLKDMDGREAASGEEGILWVRGDSNAPCYWNRPEKTSETMREGGWIYTGDRMVRDSDGYYFFKGRADDLVKVSGQWVYPLEVELCLAGHPLVRECAVLAVTMADQRITLKAFVVCADEDFDREAVAKTLQDHVKSKLLPYKYPRHVVFLEGLPKTGTGKIDRQSLLNRGDGQP
jgi:benzoate-CoA ligase family protein